MNCKKGDMAMYVGKMAEFRGHIVKCVELDGDFGPPAWVIEPMLGTYDVAFDSVLRPIRHPGVNAVDEMLLICGKPREMSA
jgi:hypothetical protein